MNNKTHYSQNEWTSWASCEVLRVRDNPEYLCKKYAVERETQILQFLQIFVGKAAVRWYYIGFFRLGADNSFCL